MTYAGVEVHLNEFISFTVEAEELHALAALAAGEDLQLAMTGSDVWTIWRRNTFPLPEI
jgi:hypothetical protein